VSNTSVKAAFAFIAVLASAPAFFAQHADPAATVKMPIVTLDPSGRKCLQGGPATASANVPHRPEIVHSNGVCWAPRNDIDDPEV
jgi:hypothetical protein